MFSFQRTRTNRFIAAALICFVWAEWCQAAQGNQQELFDNLARCAGELAAGELYESYVPGLMQLAENSQAGIAFLSQREGYRLSDANDLSKASQQEYEHRLVANPRNARTALTALADECRGYLVNLEEMHDAEQTDIKKKLADAEEVKRQTHLEAEAETEKLKAEAERLLAEAEKVRADAIERAEIAKQNTIMLEAEYKPASEEPATQEAQATTISSSGNAEERRHSECGASADRTMGRGEVRQLVVHAAMPSFGHRGPSFPRSST